MHAVHRLALTPGTDQRLLVPDLNLIIVTGSMGVGSSGILILIVLLGRLDRVELFFVGTPRFALFIHNLYYLTCKTLNLESNVNRALSHHHTEKTPALQIETGMLADFSFESSNASMCCSMKCMPEITLPKTTFTLSMKERGAPVVM